MSLKNALDKKVWGRRQSRPIKGERKAAMQTLFPALEIQPQDLTHAAALCPSSLFSDKESHQVDPKAKAKAETETETWLEIGFGGGEHVIGLLDQHPDITMLGAEPFINGMANFVKDLPEAHIPRVRVLMDDAMLLVRALEDSSISRIYILNPDPWHKKRHYKRRIVNPENLNAFARILKPGGQLIMTSDVPDLADWMVTHAVQHPDFVWQAQSHQDWSVAPADWITTRYEVKGAKGARKMCYLHFQRK